MKLPEAALSAVILDSAGDTIQLSSLWAERPAVLSFLRHFG